MRLRDARVGTMLLWVMAFFAVLIAAVGGLAAFFLQHNYESIRQVNELTERAKQVEVINSDMLRARVSLMVAARHLQESGWGSGENSARDAAAALKGATDLLTGVRSRFAEFQKNMLQDDTGRQLSMNLVRRYRSYIDDGVDTMVEALRSEDYSTFYMVNNEYGTPAARPSSRPSPSSASTSTPSSRPRSTRPRPISTVPWLPWRLRWRWHWR